jgi:hypothetical protein
VGGVKPEIIAEILLKVLTLAGAIYTTVLADRAARKRRTRRRPKYYEPPPGEANGD